MLSLAALARLVFLVGTTGGLVACMQADPSPHPDRTLPAIDALPEQSALPDLFASFFDDRRATTAADFEGWRRDELQLLFAHYVYGHPPAVSLARTEVVAEASALADSGTRGIDYVELELIVAEGAPSLFVALFVPQGVSAPPLILAPNKCGNQSLVTDARVRVTTSFLHPDCEGPPADNRGAQATLWPVAAIVDAGFALATFHESDAAPDDALTFRAGLLSARAESEPLGGALVAWATGMRLALDALHERTDVDATRTAVFGHSRRGKAALLAAAWDPRIAAVVAHQSGTMGAAITRNGLGESVDLITRTFPHWFNTSFWQFAGQETRLPVDQHALVALAAPRPVLLVDGADDAWADPSGALASARAADAAWELSGDAGLLDDPDGLPRTDATLVWRDRPGGHLVDGADWALFLAFLIEKL